MSSIAYALRDELAGTVEQDGAEVPTFTGGSVTYGDGRTFDLREALDAGDGTIVIDESDRSLVIALDGSTALKRVPVPADAPVLSGYATQTVAALRAEAKRRGLAGAGRASKDALVAALTEHDEQLAAGDHAAEASPDNPVGVDPDGDGIDTNDDQADGQED